MATATAIRMWIDKTGCFSAPGNWSPGGPPQPGDIAVIEGGTCVIADLDVSRVALVLAGWDHTVLALHDAVIGKTFLEPSPVVGDAFGSNTIEVSGRVVFAGNVTSGAEGTELTIEVARGAVLVNDGTIADGAARPSDVDILGPGGWLRNDGRIVTDGASVFATAVAGHGMIEMAAGPNSTTFGGPVGAQQTFQFDGTAAAGTAWLQIDIAREFHGVIAGFGSGDQIRLAGVAATSERFAGGTLTLFDGDATVASLRFAGHHGAADFSLTHQSGATVITG